MNLSIFFEPLSEELEEQIAHNTLGEHIHRFSGKFPDWRQANVALIGVNDWRGSLTDEPAENPADAIRQKLYALTRTTGEPYVVDLGNLLPGIEVEDTYLRLKEICELLIDHNTVPVVLGGPHDLDYGQFMAYEHLERVINMVTIDSRFDMEPDDSFGANLHRFHRILMHEPNFLFNYSQVGYQRYFVDAEMLLAMDKMHFEAIRVGQVHAEPAEIEPVLRNADMISFDIAAIRIQDAPGCTLAAPFGLTGEEACQLSWYAGTSDKLSSFGIYEYNPDLDNRGQTAALAATMVWYFIEGYVHRRNELGFEPNRFYKYAVDFHDNPHKMIFYKSRQSEKWWLEVPHISNENPPTLVPCSYQDYLAATQGEIPNRWIITQGRMG